MVNIRYAQGGDEPQLELCMKACGLYTEGQDYSQWDQPVLVAEDEGKVIGFIQCYLVKPIPIMAQLAVWPDYQHKGVGRQLGDAMEVVLKTLGITQYICFAEKGNLRLIEGYRQRGMKELGQVSQYLRKIP